MVKPEAGVGHFSLFWSAQCGLKQVFYYCD